MHQGTVHKRLRGFTIIELSLFAAIFATISIVFMTLLVVVIRIQARESSVAEVNQQSQSLLQTIQRQVEQASGIELTPDQATTTLRLRMQGATDATTIYSNGGKVYIRETDVGTPQALTTDRVVVSNLSFTKRLNPHGRDSVSTSFIVSFNSTNLQQQFTQILNTTIARVSAATFDSSIRAGTSNTYSLGASPQEWQSVNSTIYFSGSNVGIGVSGPTAKFQVTSGDVYVDTPGRGVILREGANCYRIWINGGVLTTTSVSCP